MEARTRECIKALQRLSFLEHVALSLALALLTDRALRVLVDLEVGAKEETGRYV